MLYPVPHEGLDRSIIHFQGNLNLNLALGGQKQNPQPLGQLKVICRFIEVQLGSCKRFHGMSPT
jgi:hypothetical protein